MYLLEIKAIKTDVFVLMLCKHTNIVVEIYRQILPI